MAKKRERVASLADKVCINGHKGEWVSRTQTRWDGEEFTSNYCATCAYEAQMRHKSKRLELGVEYRPTRLPLPPITTKKQMEERWAKGVLATAPAQVELLQERLKELSEMIQEARTVVAVSETQES
jgi:hypothetical protein